MGSGIKSCRLIMALSFLVIVILIGSNSRASETVTVVTNYQRYENVAYEINRNTNQMILFQPGWQSSADLGSIKFIYDQSGKDITKDILGDLGSIQDTLRLPQENEPIKSDSVFEKKESDITSRIRDENFGAKNDTLVLKAKTNNKSYKEIKLGIGLGYSRTFSDYFNTPHSDKLLDIRSEGFGDGVDYMFWIEYKLSELAVRFSFSINKYTRHIERIYYGESLKFTNKLNYYPIEGSIILKPTLGNSQVSPYIGGGMGLYFISSHETRLPGNTTALLAEADGKATKFGIHFLVGTELRLTKIIFWAIEGEYSYINGDYDINLFNRQNNRPNSMNYTFHDFDFGGINVRSAFGISFSNIGK